MTNQSSLPRKGADRGTQLGLSTRVLARVFTGVLLPFVAVGHALRRLGHTLARLARWFGTPVRVIARRLFQVIATACRRLAPLAHLIDGLVPWMQRKLRGAAESRSVARTWTLCVRIASALLALVALWYAAPVTLALIVAVPVSTTVFSAVLAVVGSASYLIFVGARQIWRWIALPIGRVLAVLSRRLARWAAAFGRVARQAGALLLAYAVEPLGRAVARCAAALGRVARQARAMLLAYLVAPVAHALRRTLAAVVMPPARALARALMLGAGWLTAATRPVGRLVAAVPDCLAGMARRTGQLFVRRNRRMAHSVGVAFLRARRRTTDVPATDSAAAGLTHRSSVTPQELPFDVVAFQNEYLPPGGTEVHAIVEVVASGTDRVNGDGPEAAEVILLDCSGSMGQPWNKLRAARHATGVAIDALREGTWFAIVRGSQHAEPVYPAGGGMTQATDATRAAAKTALRSVWPEGGTAMGQWLLLARDLFASRPTAIPHAILLTDGKNESESPASLEAALSACSGQFQCDCRGIGTDWDVAELRTISSGLLGTVDIVRKTSELADDFRTMAEAAMAKEVAGATLRVWTPQGARVRYIKQVAPAISPLTPLRTPVDARTADYPIGAWGDEAREYHLCVEVPARAVGEEMLASRVSVVVGSRATATALVKASWTVDEQLSTHIHRRVAHFTGQAHLAEAIDDGLAARKRGDERLATERFGCAVLLAHESGNEVTLQLLRHVVDIDDAATGTVRLKREVDAADEMALDTRSVKTVPVRYVAAPVVG